MTKSPRRDCAMVGDPVFTVSLSASLALKARRLTQKVKSMVCQGVCVCACDCTKTLAPTNHALRLIMNDVVADSIKLVFASSE